MIGKWRFVRFVRFVHFVICPSNKYNDGHLSLRQGLLVVLVPMSFFWKSYGCICGDGLRRRALARATAVLSLC
jgi:hypothetical protein